MENSLPYLKWQLDQVRYQYEYSTEVWGNKVSALRKIIKSKDEKIKALQREVKQSNTREDVLREELHENKQEIQRLVRKVDAWERNVLRQMEENKATKQQLQNACDQHKVELTEKEKLKLLVEGLEKDVEKWRTKASATQKSYTEMKEKKEIEVANLKEQNSMVGEMLKETDLENEKFKQEMIKAEKELQKKKAVVASLLEKNIGRQKNINEKAEKIKVLQKDLATLTDLHHTLVEKNIIFENKNMKYTHLQQAVRNLQGQVHNKMETIIILRVQVKELQKKIALFENEKQNKFKMEQANVELKGDNDELNRDIESLGTRLKVSEQQHNKQRVEMRRLEKQLRRIMFDVESCMVDIEDPRKLRKAVMKLKTNCTVSFNQVQQDESAVLIQKVQQNELIIQNIRRAKERVEQRLEFQAIKFNKEISNLFKIVNKQDNEITDLKIKLQKAALHKHIGCGIRKM
ncbi:hypothetical protein JOB18_020262 [Solea senegalensis]|uniref:Coiled-coil domain-containing protein 39 n=1 Tax=Solea senegalensis TaxID=28829 RepID=A0AAV6Q5G2_SOLSE|nr:hypothetical protein JOB18_020262 [Solea senegalensis]